MMIPNWPFSSNIVVAGLQLDPCLVSVTILKVIQIVGTQYTFTNFFSLLPVIVSKTKLTVVLLLFFFFVVVFFCFCFVFLNK